MSVYCWPEGGTGDVVCEETLNGWFRKKMALLTFPHCELELLAGLAQWCCIAIQQSQPPLPQSSL